MYFKNIIDSNKKLSALPAAEKYLLPYQKLAEMIKDKLPAMLTRSQKEALRQIGIIDIEKEVWINVEKEAVSKDKSVKLLDLVNILNSTKQKGKTKARYKTMMDFWYLVKKYNPRANHLGIDSVLDPMAIMLGYEGFSDFIETEFTPEPENFSILILPFTGNWKEQKAAETQLHKRYKTLAEKEDLPIAITLENMATEPGFCFTHEAARSIGREKNADLIVYGDLYLLQQENKINLEYALVKPNSLLRANNWSSRPSPFFFSELLFGTLPNNLDYIVYWSLGMREYQKSNYNKALLYFGKIADVLQIEDAEICYRIAVIYALLDNNKEAIAAYKKALTHNPDHYCALLNLGIQLLIDDATGAAACLERFLAGFNDPLSDSLYRVGTTYYGIALKSLGEINLAEAYLLKATEFATTNPAGAAFAEVWGRAYFELAQIHLKAAEEHNETAGYAKAKDLNLLAAAWTTDPALHESIAYFFKTYGDVAEAYQAVKKSHQKTTALQSIYQKYLDKEMC